MPSSKRKSVDNLSLDSGVELSLDQVYRMMDKVYESRAKIKTKIANATRDLLSGSVDVAFFDVTTLYFESFQPDELRVSGYSKDSKFKETQVMLALLTTTEGLPLGYELFPGNSYEGNTLLTTLETIESQYQLSSISIVADRAMFTKENLQKLEEKGVSFIVAAKLKTAKKELKEEVLKDLENAKLADPELRHWTREYEIDGRRLIVNYSDKRAAKDRSDRKRLVERVQKKDEGRKSAPFRLNWMLTAVKNRGYSAVKSADESTCLGIVEPTQPLPRMNIV
jgi:transposase